MAKLHFNEDGTTMEVVEVAEVVEKKVRKRDAVGSRKRKRESLVQKEVQFLESTYNTNPEKPTELEVVAEEKVEEEITTKVVEDVVTEKVVEEKIVDSKAKTEALSYLETFVKTRATWKFSKLRQTWLLTNMYYGHQISNEQFKDILLYLKDLGPRAKEETLAEAKDIIETPGVVGKRAKKIIKMF